MTQPNKNPAANGVKGSARLPKPHANHNLLDTSTANQRARLLAEFLAGRSISTIEARDRLNIMSPAARVLELKAEGHEIKTHKNIVHDSKGRTHTKVGVYTYHGQSGVARHD